MTFGQSVGTVFSNYVKFSGRASRSQYWWWFLFTFIIGLIFIIIGGPNAQQWSMGLTAFYGIVELVLILPTLGVTVRRLHDIGKGGGWIFIALVPLIGWIWYLVLMVTPGQPGPNRFGNVAE